MTATERYVRLAGTVIFVLSNVGVLFCGHYGLSVVPFAVSGLGSVYVAYGKWNQ